MRHVLLIAALVALSFHARGSKIKGIIIKQGESKEVTFDIKVPWLSGEPNFERLQYKVKYYSESGKKETLRPEDADEIRFKYQGMEVRMISCSNNLNGSNFFSTSSRIFLKLEIEGPLRLYRFYYKQTSPGVGGYGGAGSYSPSTTYTVENLIFQKGNGPLKQPRSMGWKKDMVEYFSDCPALRAQIESKELRKKEIEAIVMYYNHNCGKE